jgi:hypothetical protein
MRVFGCLALCLLGCGHDEVLSPDPVTEPCSSEPAECAGIHDLRSCVSGLWQERACRDVCREQVPGSTSAWCQAALAGPAACVCTPPSCESRPPVCDGSHTLALCKDGLTVEYLSCFDICQGTPETPFSAGCDFDRELGEDRCYCTSEGAACTGTEWDQCEGTDALGRCQDGKWTVVPCAELCGEPESLCGFAMRSNQSQCACVGRDAG